MYRQMINFIELMVVSLMALVATSISMLTWYQVVGMFFAAMASLFVLSRRDWSTRNLQSTLWR